MKSYQIAKALRSQQNETFKGTTEETQTKRQNLIEDVLKAERQLYALGDERHIKSVITPAERIDVLSTLTDRRLFEAFGLYQIRINKLATEAINRFKALQNEFKTIKA